MRVFVLHVNCFGFKVFFWHLLKWSLAGVFYSRTPFKICYKSFLEYFSIDKAVIINSGLLESAREPKTTVVGGAKVFFEAKSHINLLSLLRA